MTDRATMPDELRGPDYIQLDALAEKIGEDPGRWLDGNLDPLPRIRGLATLARVREWGSAERWIARIRNRSPDSAVMDALDRRWNFLEDYEPDPDFERDIPEKTVMYHKRDGEVVPMDEVDRTVAGANLGQRAATDGGEAGGE